MINYLWLLIATLLLAAEFGVQKLYQGRMGTSPKAGFFYNAMNGLFTVIIFFCVNGFKVTVTPFSVIMGILMTGFAVFYSVIALGILKLGGMSVYTVFLMTGGMTLPYIYGLIFLDEEINIFRVIGLLVIIVAVFVSGGGMKKVSPKLLALCSAVFVLNGLVGIVSKQHQVEAASERFATAGTMDFVIITGAIKFIMCLVAYFIASAPKNAEKIEKKTALRALPLVVIVAVVSGISYALQLVGASNLPASVMFPIITGGSIIFSSLAGKIFFKEKLSKLQWISIAMCFIGTCLFLDL